MGCSVGQDRRYLKNYETVKEVDRHNAKIEEGHDRHFENEIDSRARYYFPMIAGIPLAPVGSNKRVICPVCLEHFVWQDGVCSFCYELKQDKKYIRLAFSWISGRVPDIRNLKKKIFGVRIFGKETAVKYYNWG